MESRTRPLALLGVTAGIAAYKAVDILRGLDKAGFDVQVVMTEGATRFIAPLTFQALSRRPVARDMFAERPASHIPHVELASQIEVAVVAPATANFLARHAMGMGDDLLTTMLLATRAPIVLAPAMNCGMWENPLVQQNVEKLASLPRYTVVPPACGELACGVVGRGRLAPVEDIIQTVLRLAGPGDLADRRVVINAGPTHEPLDPVRYLGNRSSGKMGYAIARNAHRRGARVTLVSGPVELSPPPGVELCRVETARQMHTATIERSRGCDVAILTAAVADWTPRHRQDHKITKESMGSGGVPAVELELNPDILRDLCDSPHRPPLVVGFGAEDSAPPQVLARTGMAKLARKGCDLMVVNPVDREGSVFGSELNQAVMVGAGRVLMEDSGPVTKDELANLILDRVVVQLRKESADPEGDLPSPPPKPAGTSAKKGARQ